eukprot:GHVL01036675.1.p2 GENE.GHVL01036675.1~~GHVL01036675.1.p2  ORF type:complete len:117 (+),score=25.65 GHVL01036675.1:700-1050(+)
MNKGELGTEAKMYSEGCKSALAEVVMFSACRDGHTSADVGCVSSCFDLPKVSGPGGAGGACTHALISVIHKKGQNIKLIDLLENMREILQERGFSQILQLSSTINLNLDEIFSLVD